MCLTLLLVSTVLLLVVLANGGLSTQDVVFVFKSPP